ncbi:tetratricopeptide repeat protein [Maribacter sp.]|nr:tetratricopeptide repeat protein [Maribacter sp.]
MDKEKLLYHYFSNSLSAQQEKQLQDLLDTDMEFKEQFDFEKDLKRVVREEEKTKLKSKLQGFEKEIAQERPVIQLNQKPKKSKFNWSIAASVAILFGLGWFGYNTFAGADYESLYEANFEEYPNTVYAVTRGEAIETIERDAFTAYESGGYQSAIDNFKKIYSADNKDYLDFYLGQSYLGLGEITQAKESFEKVLSSNSDFIPEAHWYLALISIKQENKTAATKYLNELIANHEYNKGKARALLKDLE